MPNGGMTSALNVGRSTAESASCQTDEDVNPIRIKVEPETDEDDYEQCTNVADALLVVIKTEPEDDDDDDVASPTNHLDGEVEDESLSLIRQSAESTENQVNDTQCGAIQVFIKTKPPESIDDGVTTSERAVQSCSLRTRGVESMAQQNIANQCDVRQVIVKIEPVDDDVDVTSTDGHPEEEEDENCSQSKPDVASAENATDVLMFCKAEYDPDADAQDASIAPKGKFKYLKYFKKSSCCYCLTLHANMTEHLLWHHRNEEGVRAIVAEPLEPNRKCMWTLLRNKGNHMHNVEVLKNGKGTLIVGFDSTLASVIVHTFCPGCLFYYNESVFEPNNRHYCPVDIIAKRQIKQEMSDSLLFTATDHEALLALKVSPILLRTMRTDATFLDWALRIASEFQGAGLRPIRSNLEKRLKQIAQILSCLRNRAQDETLTLAQVIHPDNLSNVLDVLHVVAGFSSKFPTITTIRGLLHRLNECAMMCKTGSLRQGLRDQAEIYDEFIRQNIPELYGLCPSSGDVPAEPTGTISELEESDDSDSGKKRSCPRSNTRASCKRRVSCEVELEEEPCENVPDQEDPTPGIKFKYKNLFWKARCCFCGALLNGKKFMAHLRTQHGQEREVLAIFQEGHQLNRQNMWSLLRNRGNQVHNQKTLQDGEGVLLVSQKQSFPTCLSPNYVRCPDCEEYYTVEKRKHICPAVELANRQARLEKVHALLRTQRRIWEERMDSLNTAFAVADEILRTDPDIREWALHRIVNFCTFRVVRRKTTRFPRSKIVLHIAPVIHFLGHARREFGAPDMGIAQVFDPDNADAALRAVETFVENSAGGPDRYRLRTRKLLFALVECAGICRLGCLERGAVDLARRYGEFMIRCVPEAYGAESEFDGSTDMAGDEDHVLETEGEDILRICEDLCERAEATICSNNVAEQ